MTPRFPVLTSVVGGEGGIRTLDTFPYTHFPGVLLKPLGHLTGKSLTTYRQSF